MFRLLCICREELERWKALYQRENFQQSTVNGHWICGTEVLFVPCSEEDTKYIKWHSDKTRVNLERICQRAPLSTVKPWVLPRYAFCIKHIYKRFKRWSIYERWCVWSAVIRFRCGVLKFGHGIVHKPDLAALVQCKRLLLKLWLLEEKNYKAYFFFFRTSIWSYYFVITPIDQNKWRLEILIITSK